LDAATKDIENIKGVRTVESAGGETRETCYCRVYQKRLKHMLCAAWLFEIGHNTISALVYTVRKLKHRGRGLN